MQKALWLIAAAMLVVPASARAQQSNQQQTQQATQQSGQQADQTKASSQAPAQQDSLAEAARKTREQKKEAPKAAKVFTNDNIPTAGGVSTVGASTTGSTSGAQPSAEEPKGADEKAWREKFATLRGKLTEDQTKLDVLQREAGTDQVQFYGGNPQKAAQDQQSMQPFGTDYSKKVSDIDAAKKAVAADQQAISDAEDDLRKAGGDPGWAR